MTIQELVYKLTDIINSSEGNDRLQVRVNAATGNEDCWVHEDMVKIEPFSQADPTKIVRIYGGFGA